MHSCGLGVTGCYEIEKNATCTDNKISLSDICYYQCCILGIKLGTTTVLHLEDSGTIGEVCVPTREGTQKFCLSEYHGKFLLM